MIPDGGDAIRNRDSGEGGAAGERLFADGSDALRNAVFRGGKGTGICNQPFLRLVKQDPVNYRKGGMFRRNGDLCKLTAIQKRIRANFGNAVRNRDSGEGFAVGERHFPDGGDA